MHIFGLKCCSTALGDLKNEQLSVIVIVYFILSVEFFKLYPQHICSYYISKRFPVSRL